MTSEYDNYNQCVECEAWVIPVTMKGDCGLLSPSFYAGYIVDTQDRAQQYLVHKPHECRQSDIGAHRRRLEVERSIAPDKSKPFTKANDYEDSAKPYNITCPRCDQDPGRRCLNIRNKNKPQYRLRYVTKPHRERLEAGLLKQGLELVYDKDLNRYYIRKTG